MLSRVVLDLAGAAVVWVLQGGGPVTDADLTVRYQRLKVTGVTTDERVPCMASQYDDEKGLLRLRVHCNEPTWLPKLVGIKVEGRGTLDLVGCTVGEGDCVDVRLDPERPKSISK